VYVRSNFPTPQLDASHVVRVSGAVEHAYEFAVSSLADMPQHEVLVTMECAGNWRLGMDPVPEGEPWRYGAVSTTTWRGVRVADVLARAGVRSNAVELLATGADCGERSDADAPGPVTFARSLPMDVALHPDTLLATHMDGEPLSPHHGAPLRLLVPGWYGMASVKWVTSLEVLTTPYTGYFQRTRYVYRSEAGDTPVSRALVKSFVTSITREGEMVHVRGWAWSGFGHITQVDVQVNGGTWVAAELAPGASPYAWSGFAVAVPIAPAGDGVVVRSRATDSAGNIQPERAPWNALGYGNNGITEIRAD
jgi:DMSO/TMAO reductase YedYZ molybdopterin-dependent catalytic subunit